MEVFDEGIREKLHECIQDIRFIRRRTQKNKGKTGNLKLASELHDTQIKLHEIEEEVYAWTTFMNENPKTSEEPAVDEELQAKIQLKFQEMKPSLNILRDPDSTPEDRDVCLVLVQELCDELYTIVFQPLSEAEVFEPDPGFKPTKDRENGPVPTHNSRRRHEQISTVEISQLST